MGNTNTKKRRAFRQYYYRGINIMEMIDMPDNEFKTLCNARMRRKLDRGKKPGQIYFEKKVKKAKKTGKVVRTHLRNICIMPWMVASKIAVYNGKEFREFEIK